MYREYHIAERSGHFGVKRWQRKGGIVLSMKYLAGEQLREAMRFLSEAEQMARQSTCLRRRCGAVIVSDGQVVGAGYNSPAGGERHRCTVEKRTYDAKVTDKTCCMHAEQRAVLDALRRHPDYIAGSTIFFVSVDVNGIREFAGEPYCTVCSKLCVDTGIAFFILAHERGVCSYPAARYNTLSYHYSPAADTSHG